MSVKQLSLYIIALLLSVPGFYANATVRAQQNGSGSISTSYQLTQNGYGQINIAFISPTGGNGTFIYCNPEGPIHDEYIAAYAVVSNQVQLVSKADGSTYTVAIGCPQNSDGNVCREDGTGVMFIGPERAWHTGSDTTSIQCQTGVSHGALSQTTTLNTSISMNLKTNHIPAGDYIATMTGSVGEYAELTQGQYNDYTSQLIAAGISTQYGAGRKITTPITVPSYTICNTTDNVALNHGTMTPDQVAGNAKSQSFIINCDGPASIVLSLNDTNPTVGTGVSSHIQISSDNVNWADNLNTKLSNSGSQTIYTSSTLAVTGPKVIGQILNGSTVLTMKYQ